MLRRVRMASAERSRWVAPSVLPVLLLTPLLCLRHLRVIYTSDSAAQQSIVRTWLDVGHGTTYLPQDTWALKVPLYLVLENLPLTPRERMLTAVLVLNAVTFLLLGWAAWKLAAAWGNGVRWYEVAVPVAWLSTLGGGIGSNRMLTNYRNIELGICFVVLAVTARYLSGRREPGPTGETGPNGPTGPTGPNGPTGLGRRESAEVRDSGRARIRLRPSRLRGVLLGSGAAVLLSTLWFDDPYFSSLLALPLAGAALVWFVVRQRERRLLYLAGVLAASIVVASGLRAIAGQFGIVFVVPPHTLDLAPADLLRSVRLLTPSTRLLLGLDRWDGGAGWWLMRVLVVLAMVLMLAASTALAVRGWRERRFVVTYLGLHWPVVVVGFLVSWYSQNASAGRYLILGVYDLVVATVVLLPQLRPRRPGLGRLLVGVLAVGAALNLGTGLSATIDAARAPSQAVQHQQQIVRALQRAVAEHGAVKGYAPFWDANINTYLAGEGTTAAEIVCRNGRFGTRQWLSDTSRLTRPASGPVFLIWDPIAVSLAGCPASVRDAQFGPPLASYPVTPTTAPSPGGGVTAVLVYPADLETRLQP